MAPDDPERTADGNAPAAELAFGHFLMPRRADGGLWELGRGAMGVTYRAFETSLRTEVALKVIRAEQIADADTRRRFQREARAAAKIRHPNVASVLYLGDQGGEFFYAWNLKLLPAERLTGEPDFGQTLETALQKARQYPHPVLLAHIGANLGRSGNSAFYVREWADGFSLDKLLRARNGKLRAAETFRLLDALPDALDFAHAHAFPFLEVALRKLFVVPIHGQAANDGPAFALKLNPLGFPLARRRLPRRDPSRRCARPARPRTPRRSANQGDHLVSGHLTSAYVHQPPPARFYRDGRFRGWCHKAEGSSGCLSPRSQQAHASVPA